MNFSLWFQVIYFGCVGMYGTPIRIWYQLNFDCNIIYWPIHLIYNSKIRGVNEWIIKI